MLELLIGVARGYGHVTLAVIVNTAHYFLDVSRGIRSGRNVADCELFPTCSPLVIVCVG